MALIFPEIAAPPRCVMISLDARLLPIIAGALKPLTHSYAWQTSADYQRGYNAIAALYAQMSNSCLDDLIRGQDRTYRLLDAALFGRAYVTAGVDPLTGQAVIVPAIADVPDLIDRQLPGLIARLEKIERLFDNTINGTIYADYNDLPSLRARLEQLLIATQATDDLDPQLLDRLVAIAGLLA